MADLIDRVAADQWTAPTPCTEWNVRDLVGHLVGMNLVFVAMFEGTPMPERGPDRLGADPEQIADNAPAIDRLAAFTDRRVPWTVALSSHVTRLRLL